MRFKYLFGFQGGAKRIALGVVSILFLETTSGQSTTLADLALWVRDSYPEWREEDSNTVIEGVATTLDDFSGALTAEQRQLLVEAGMERIQSVFTPDRGTVPADFTLFAETYRVGVEDFVTRAPLSETEQATLEAQVEEIFDYGVGLIAASSAADSESAAAMLESTKAYLDSTMHDPLSNSLKQPFSREAMNAIREEMELVADEFAAGESPRGLPGGEMSTGLAEVLAETFASRLFTPLAEIDAERSPPISEEMRDLLQRQADQNFEIIEEQRDATVSAHHERMRVESQAAAHELSRLREAQVTVPPPARKALRENLPVPMPSSSAPSIFEETPSSSQGRREEAYCPPWSVITSILGMGAVALLTLRRFRHRAR